MDVAVSDSELLRRSGEDAAASAELYSRHGLEIHRLVRSADQMGRKRSHR